MAGLVPAIYVFGSRKDVDARDERGHDEPTIESGVDYIPYATDGLLARLRLR